MLCAKPWKVKMDTLPATAVPSKDTRRSLSSSRALLVKVMTSKLLGGTPESSR